MSSGRKDEDVYGDTAPATGSLARLSKLMSVASRGQLVQNTTTSKEWFKTQPRRENGSKRNHVTTSLPGH